MSKVRVILEAQSDFLKDFADRGFISNPIEDMINYWLSQYQHVGGCQFVPKVTRQQVGDDVEFVLGLDIRKLDYSH